MISREMGQLAYDENVRLREVLRQKDAQIKNLERRLSRYECGRRIPERRRPRQ